MEKNENQTKEDSGLPSRPLIGSTASLEKKLFEALTDGRNGVYYHWHSWTVRDMLAVIMPVIKRHLEKQKR